MINGGCVLSSWLEGHWGFCIMMVSAWQIPSGSLKGLPKQASQQTMNSGITRALAPRLPCWCGFWDSTAGPHSCASSLPTALSPEPGRGVFKGKLLCFTSSRFSSISRTSWMSLHLHIALFSGGENRYLSGLFCSLNSGRRKSKCSK